MVDLLGVATLGVLGLVAVLLIVVLTRKPAGPDMQGLQAQQQMQQHMMAQMTNMERSMQTELQRAQKEVQESRVKMQETMTNFERAVGKSLQGTQKEVGESKDKMADSLKEFHKQMAEVNKTVVRLTSQQEGAGKLAEDLKVLMQQPKLRGDYGEVALEEMLGRVLPDGMWDRQVRIDGLEAVDAAVFFRDTTYPIDAKFPRDDYERYLEAEGPDKAAAWRGFENAMKRQVDSIASKYIKPEKGTSEFALMFIPSEAVYYETITERNGIGQPNPLLEYAQKKQVVPVSPNTFFAFLQIILVGARNVELVRSAKQLQESLADVRLSFDRFFKKYDDIGRSIGKASDAFRISEDHGRRLRERMENVLELRLEDRQEPLPLDD